MKKGKAVIVTVLFGIMLVGCTEDNSTVGNEFDTEIEVAEHNGDIVVGYAQVGSESDWRTANTESFKEVFTEENGYYLIFEDGQQKQENQVKAIRKFILQEVDYIVLDPIVETGWEAVLQEAKEAGIPVILSDRMVEVEDESLYTCWVGSDFKEEGRKAGEWLEVYLQEKQERNETDDNQKDGDDAGRLESDKSQEDTVKIVTLLGTPESSAQLGRSEGFAEVMSQHENWVMLEEQSGEFTQAKAQEIMAQYLEEYEDIDVVISQNDNMAFGAIMAIKEAGKTIGPDGDIIIISFDAVEDSFHAMEKGEIVADFECNPLLAPLVEEVILQIEQGKEVEKVQYVDETYFDYNMDLATLLKERNY